jgi:hypothetical protein
MRSLFAFALGLLAMPASAAQYYSTTGMIGNIRPGPVYDSNLDEMARYGITPQLIVVVDGADSNVMGQLHGYQLTAQAMNALLNDAQQRTGQRKVALDLFNLFFYTESFPEGQRVPCPGYALPAGSTADADSVRTARSVPVVVRSQMASRRSSLISGSAPSTICNRSYRSSGTTTQRPERVMPMATTS